METLRYAQGDIGGVYPMRRHGTGMTKESVIARIVMTKQYRGGEVIRNEVKNPVSHPLTQHPLRDRRRRSWQSHTFHHNACFLDFLYREPGFICHLRQAQYDKSGDSILATHNLILTTDAFYPTFFNR